MPEQAERFEWIGKAARAGLICTLAFLGLCLIGTVALTVMAILDARGWLDTAPLVLACLAHLVAGVWAFVLYGLVRVIVANEFAVSSAAGRLGRVETLMQQQTASSEKLIDMASLSDQARSLIFREREVPEE